jgi:phosphate transport system substrate-binding protein
MLLEVRTSAFAVTLGILGWMMAGCGGGPAAPKNVELRAGGASAPYPAYSKWITELKKEFKEITITYEPTGSARGIEDLKAGKLDFAGTDRPLTDSELAQFAVKPLHFPVLLDAVVPVYNLPQVKEALQFDGEALAGIFTGRIKRWNDPALARLNPGVALPGLAISVVHRSDGSGARLC